jgi:hypothetical protein
VHLACVGVAELAGFQVFCGVPRYAEALVRFGPVSLGKSSPPFRRRKYRELLPASPSDCAAFDRFRSGIGRQQESCSPKSARLTVGCVFTHASNMAAIPRYANFAPGIVHAREHESVVSVCRVDGLELQALARANQPHRNM